MQFGVAVELRLQHFVGGGGVGGGGVCIFQIFAAVEFVGGAQGALFHFVEYDLHIDKFVAFQVDVDAGAQKLFGQQRNVEPVGVESAQIASFDGTGYVVGHGFECGAIFHIVIGDAVYGGGLFGNVHLGVDAHGLTLFRAVGRYFQIRYFDNAVGHNVGAGGFEVEEYDGIFQI